MLMVWCIPGFASTVSKISLNRPPSWDTATEGISLDVWSELPITSLVSLHAHRLSVITAVKSSTNILRLIIISPSYYFGN